MSFQPIHDTAHRQRQLALLVAHPDETPADLEGALPYLIHPPGKFSATARFIDFRDRTVRPMIEQNPADPNLPRFLAQVEAVLAWRASVPAEDRFWRADPA
jgi:hypothetical protein